MKITKLLPKLFKLEADEEKVFAKYDKSEIYGSTLLVPSDDTSKYIEIEKEDKDENNNL